MLTGKVKFYNSEKGFGFLSPTDGSSDLFFHVSGIQCEESILQDGQSVSFEIGEGKKGPCAVNVNAA
jgi:CspA family cold shock protein